MCSWFRTELSTFGIRITLRGSKMRSKSNNLQSRTWIVLAVSSIVLAYPFVRLVVPVVVKAVVPEVVRTVLNVL